jgi:hypothetical protein
LDLAILIGAPKMFDTVTGKQVFDEVNLPKKLAQKLPELAEPLRTIAAARILIEKKHPEYNVRLMVVQLLGSWLRNLPYLEIHHLFLQNLRGFFKDPVLSVQIIAREQAISLLDKLSESDAQFLWNEMKVPENFLKAAKKRNFYAIILTFRFATLGWKYFSPSEKEKIANIALDTFYWVIKERSAATQGGVTDQLATNIAIFLTQHKNDLSPSLRIKIGSSAFIAKVLLKHLPLMTDATISIAHLLEIGDEEVRRVFENWAWSKLEQKEYPLNIAFSISVILTSLFNNDPAGDLVRSKRWNVYNHLLRWVVHERSDMRLIGRETLHEIIKKMPRAEIYQVYVRLISLKNSDLSETIKQEIDQLMAKVVLEKAH